MTLPQTCARKNSFDNRRQAKNHAKKLTSFGGKRAEAYRCPTCGYWHVTQKKKMNYKIKVRDNQRAAVKAHDDLPWLGATR